ncbi:MAG: preprotein translocase subunit YajC [Actinobacteria bacterium]|nr:preprotein translocase subunit YajC [Actinomycetota bacterium]
MEALPNLVFLALLVGVFYFLLIRPQKKRVDQHRRLIESVGVGDEIITIGGLLGTVRGLDDEHVQLEIAAGTTVRFTKAAIARRLSEEPTVEESETSVGTTRE